jgi:Predicted glycosyltransferase
MRTPFISQDPQNQFFSTLHSVFRDISVADAIGWNTPRFAVNITILSLAVIAIVTIGILYVRKYLQKRTEEKRKTVNLFLENKERCKLTDVEAEYLQSLLRHQNVTDPHVIFQSLQLFEKCLDSEVLEILRSRPSQEEVRAKDELISEIRRKLGFHHLPLEHPLVSTRNISMGQIGSVFGRNNNRPLFRKVTVVDNGPFVFRIQYDVEKEDVVHIVAGNSVRFAFARQNDGLYGMEVEVAKAENTGTVDLYHTLDMRRNQLRQYVRIETGLALKFRLIKTPDPFKSEVKVGELIAAKLSDVSGGGLSFLYEKSLRLGDIVSLNFDLPGASCAGITGKIVHLSLREGKNGTLFKNHVQFVNIEPRKREKIITYVFEKERQISQWR